MWVVESVGQVSGSDLSHDISEDTEHDEEVDDNLMCSEMYSTVRSSRGGIGGEGPEEGFDE